MAKPWLDADFLELFSYPLEHTIKSNSDFLPNQMHCCIVVGG